MAVPRSTRSTSSSSGAEALAVLRGVRRNTLLPFFKRLIAEGLWMRHKAFSSLVPEERCTLMHGFWNRPGHGSFLKSPSATPDDVRSWLRWDGLVGAVLRESERSRHEPWRKELTASLRSVVCPRCQGTGLQLHSHAIRLASRSWFEWVRAGTIEQLLAALAASSAPTQRGERLKQRIAHCLEPLALSLPRAPLREPIRDPDLLRPVFERVVHSMTRLRVLN